MAHQGIVELLNGFRKSKVLFAAVKLGVFDLLESSAPAGLTSEQVATRLGAKSLGGVDSLLRACVSLGLLSTSGRFTKDSNGSPTIHFANSLMAARYLTTKSNESLVGYVKHSDDVLYKLWDHLDESVLTEKPAWEKAFPKAADEEGVFDKMYQSQEDMQRFLFAMHGIAETAVPTLLNAIERFSKEMSFAAFNDGGVVVDLGGATGTVALAVSKKYPSATVTIVDLPSVIDNVTKVKIQQAAASGVIDGSKVKAAHGDFLDEKSDLPEANVYILSRIVHDWGDVKSNVILQKVFKSLKPGGAVILLEKIIDDVDRSDGFGVSCGSVDVHLQNLNMLVQTEGKERTIAEFAKLLRAVGFGDVWSCKTGGALDCVAALKPQ